MQPRFFTPLLFALSAPLTAQSTVRVSVDSQGVQANAFSVTRPSISADGRFTAFLSSASNLVPNDTNLAFDIFVHDALTGATVRGSVANDGSQAQLGSATPSLSADGRKLGFVSAAPNLVLGDNNDAADMFIRDLVSGQTQRVSIGTSGVEGDDFVFDGQVSANGQVVAFTSGATNVVAGDVNTFQDVFVRDLQTGVTTRVSVSSSAQEADNSSLEAVLSANGNVVAFTSLAANLVAGDTNDTRDVFVHDRTAGTTTRVSVSSAGLQGNDQSHRPQLSADGRFVVFQSLASNFVSSDSNSVDDVFLHDRVTGTTTRLSEDSAGNGGNEFSFSPSISANGRFVSFGSVASNLVPQDLGFGADLFAKDLQTGRLTLLSIGLGGVASNGDVLFTAISGDGRFVASNSTASNLVAGDTNDTEDMFVTDYLGAPGDAFCLGDGSGTACPCANASPVGDDSGCLNSLGSGGKLVGAGSPSIAGDTLVLSGSQMPNASALYFQGTTQAAGGAGTVFGDGLRCATGAIVRLATKTNAGGSSEYPQASDPSISVRGSVTMPGTRTYQVWYRNAAAFCSPSGFNLTNGWRVNWTL